MEQYVIEFTHPIGEYAMIFAMGFPTLLLIIMIVDSIYGLLKKSDPEDKMW